MSTLTLGETNISKTVFQIGEETISIDTYHCQFIKWSKPINFDTYGSKPVLNWKDEPLFAELYLLRTLENQGFLGAWIDTYRGKFWNGHPSFTLPINKLPAILQDVYDAVKLKNENKRKGCWDVLAAKNDEIVFAELKRTNKDQIRQNQIDWLCAGINTGLSGSNFIIIDWDYVS